MIDVVGKLFTPLIKKSAYLDNGREIIINWCRQCIQDMNHDDVRILDIGCGKGTDLLNLQNSIRNRKLGLFGIECYEPDVKQAKQKGINVFQLNIEDEPIPTKDEFFDIVIANHIIEHTKEIFWIFSEISRTLKKKGILIVGIPNLASLHNRIFLLLGEQPSTIEVLSAHVRGFTAPSFKRFVEADDYFKVLKVCGANFYPFSPSIANFLSKLFPTFSEVLFSLVRRQNKKGSFIQVLGTRFSGTPYFRGRESCKLNV